MKDIADFYSSSDDNNPLTYGLRSTWKRATAVRLEILYSESFNTEDHFYWLLVAYNPFCHGVIGAIAAIRNQKAYARYFLA